MSKIKQNIFQEFPKISTSRWEEIIKADLKGADYDKNLITKTIEEINIKPYYRPEDIENLNTTKQIPGEFPFSRGNNSIYLKNKNRQKIIVNDCFDANKKAIELISKGINSICFDLSTKEKIKIGDFVKLFEEIDITKNEINFILGKNALNIIKLFKEVVTFKQVNSDEVFGSMDFDPLGFITLTGNKFLSKNYSNYDDLKSTFDYLHNNFPNFRIININASIFPNSGATAVQETAYALSMGVEYLSRASAEKIELEKLIPKIQFTFGIGSNYFMEIAKFRAIRLLWAKIIKAYFPKNPDFGKMYIHAQTIESNKTIYNPYINILRTTTETMSAIVAGVEAITVNTFDSGFKTPTELSERIARNTQIILNEEAMLDKVIDPAGGSYFIESLTDSIAKDAWKLFLETEAVGGYYEALKKGLIQDKIEETVKKRKIDFTFRKTILLGANQYPLQNETAIEIINNEIYYKESEEITTEIRPLKPFRGAIEIEEIRLKTEISGKTPKVFLLTFGNISMRKARAAFTSNFFACGGFQILDNPGFETIEKACEQVKYQKPEITVICSSDDEYLNIAPEIYNKLKNETIIVIAGNPANNEELLKIGITNFIHIKSDLISTLSDFQKKLNMN